MTPDREDPYHLDIIDMLGVESSDDLALWTQAWTRARYPMATVRAVRVFPGTAARQKSETEEFAATDLRGLSDVVPISNDPLMLQALHTRSCRQEKSPAASRHVFPLHAAGEVRYAFDITLPGPAGALRISELADMVQAYFSRLASLETDPLTRLRTRRVFQSHVDASLKAWIQSDRPYYLAVLDIDRFKRINDTYGHLYGDEILVHFSNLMRRTFRSRDLLYRFGGEEFVLIYSVERGVAGDVPLERFRAAVESYAFPGVGTVTVSSGFAAITDLTTPAATLVDRADAAVYYAKEHGRNQVRCWEVLRDEGQIASKDLGKDVTLF
jgi:diguanylate cyclase (GGDEF)-like protein